MHTLYSPFALLGSSLSFSSDVVLTLTDDGFIHSIDSCSSPSGVDFLLPSGTVLLPGFINAHTHLGDFFLKDRGFSFSLADVVGPGGLKHSFLASQSSDSLLLSLRRSLSLLVSNGYTSFVDFREGGVSGSSALRSLLPSFSLRGLILGRPFANDKLSDLFHFVDGIGFSDFTSFFGQDSLLSELNDERSRRSDFLVSLHIAETEDLVTHSLSLTGKTDLEYSLDSLDPSFVIHGNYLSSSDLTLLKERNVGLVCCPLTASLFNLRFPPIHECLEKDILVSLATDNIMIADVNPFFLMRYTILSLSSQGYYVSPRSILRMMTVNPGLMLNQKIGQISPGYSADFVGVDLTSLNILESKDVYHGLVFRSSVKDINFQMFKGRRIK